MQPAAALAEPSPSSDGWTTFTANWSASGLERTLATGEGSASIFEIRGPMVVTSGDGMSRGFLGQAIGFVDRGKLGVGRLVLTDDDGNAIFNDLQGQGLGNGKQIRGTITGGTGRYAGIEGDLVFDWQYVIHTGDGMVQGRAVGLSGRFRRGDANAPPAAPGADGRP
jgi:hypothetical protein